jgi:acyl-CoA thioesterase
MDSLQDRVARVPFLRALDIRLLEVGDAHAVMEVEVTETHLNYMKGVHGGLVATLIDAVCFYPRPLIPSGRVVTTTSLNVTYVRPAKLGDKLVARSELLHLGRRTASVAARITDGQGKLVAHGTAGLMVLKDPDGTLAG